MLEARDVEFDLRREFSGWRLLAPEEEAERARAELAAYHSENMGGGRPQPLPDTGAAPVVPALLVCLLVPFHVLATRPWPRWGVYPHELYAAGQADSGAMLTGEAFRALTALTLHGDAAHLLGNVVVGAVFAALLCRRAGTGPGMLALVLSGMLGNLLNAWMRGPGHLSIGFSTAVFGAAGLLGALGFWGGHRSPMASVAAGLGLLGLLGVGGERTDLGAHVFGFAAGLALGAGLGWLLTRLGRPGPAVDGWLTVCAVALPVWAWFVALG